MTVHEIARRSGYSRQWLNKLVDLGIAPGLSRKQSGRLEVQDEKLVAHWCERLRRRKESRRQNNEERKARRIERRMLLDGLHKPFDAAAELQHGARQIRQRVIKDHPAVVDFPQNLVNEAILDTARRAIGGAFQLILRLRFGLRGKRPETREARMKLFDFVASPGSLSEVRSYADIARACGCTRAAVSAMARQLPSGLSGRSGRIRKRL
jgi:hypothetical protein